MLYAAEAIKSRAEDEFCVKWREKRERKGWAKRRELVWERVFFWGLYFLRACNLILVKP